MISVNNILIISTASFLVAIGIPGIVDGAPIDPNTYLPADPTPGSSGLGSLIEEYVVIITAITVMAALVSIVIGGYIYMTAGGSADRVRLAKSFIGSALFGMALALMAWLILKSINPSLVTYPI